MARVQAGRTAHFPGWRRAEAPQDQGVVARILTASDPDQGQLLRLGAGEPWTTNMRL
jgi:hypothetical protein